MSYEYIGSIEEFLAFGLFFSRNRYLLALLKNRSDYEFLCNGLKFIGLLGLIKEIKRI